MTDIDMEQFANMKNELDDLKSRYAVLEEKQKTHDEEIRKRDEKIHNLNDLLYNSMFSTKKDDTDRIDDEPKSFEQLYNETIKSMKK